MHVVVAAIEDSSTWLTELVAPKESAGAPKLVGSNISHSRGSGGMRSSSRSPCRSF